MRNIKFRGKSRHSGNWVYGDLLQLHDGRRYIVNNKFGACIDAEGNFINTEAPFVHEVESNTVGQYIRLNENGVEMYENDIVKSFMFDTETGENFDVVGVIKCFEDYGQFLIDPEHSDYDGDLFELDDTEHYCVEYFEVIGNVHDNPDLLKNG